MGHDWSRRSEERELMDLPEADERRLIATVEQFRLINRLLSRSRTLLRAQILQDARARGLSRIRLLDLGAGGCDIAHWFVAEAENFGIEAKVLCLDYDPRIVAYARRKYAADSRLEVVEASAEELPSYGPVDYLFANHFLHHLRDEEIVRLLPLLEDQVRYAYVLNDLLRSPLSYFGYSLLASIFFRHSFALYDGRLSIRRGFTESDFRYYLERTSLTNAVRVRELFPGRIALVRTKSRL